MSRFCVSERKNAHWGTTMQSSGVEEGKIRRKRRSTVFDRRADSDEEDERAQILADYADERKSAGTHNGGMGKAGWSWGLGATRFAGNTQGSTNEQIVGMLEMAARNVSGDVP